MPSNISSEIKQISHKKLTVQELFYSSLRKKTYIELGISLILLVCLIIFILIPTFNTLDTVNEKISKYKDLNQKVQNNINHFKLLKNIINDELRNEINFINLNSKLTENDLDVIYINLFKRSQQYNLKLTNFQVKKNNATSINDVDKFYKTKYLTINSAFESSKIEDIINFLKSIESYNEMPLILRLENVSIVYYINKNQEDKKEPNDKMESKQNNQEEQKKLVLNLKVNAIIF